MNPSIETITVKALYDINHKLISAVIERGCNINPACWESTKNYADRIARTLAIGAGHAQCPGKKGCELQIYLGLDGRPKDYASYKGPNCFEHLISYSKREVDPEEICLTGKKPK